MVPLICMQLSVSLSVIHVVMHFILFLMSLNHFSNIICIKQETSIDHFPFLVSIRRNILEIENFTAVHTCAGVIFTGDEVLTTASCLHDVQGNALLRPYSFTITAGVSDLKEATNFERFSALVKIHPRFSLGSLENDIAVIRLDKHLPINNKTIALANLETSEIQEGKPCSIVGWGATAMKPFINLSGKLYKNNVHINKDCAGFLFFEYNIRIKDTQICAGSNDPNEDTCFQDTGSPLICDNRIVGLANVYNECKVGKTKGTAYTKVSKYTDFIFGIRGSISASVKPILWTFIIIKISM